jgi:hypothetical protein
MTTKLAGALAAGALAVGILVGAAGTVLVHDTTRPTMGMGDMTQMQQMMDMMGGGMMGDGMMGDGADMPMRGIDPADHQRHHSGANR